MTKEPVLVLVLSLVVFATGLAHDELRPKRQAPSTVDCMKPPMKRFARQCCRLPNERIWGDLRLSLNKCMGQRKIIQRTMQPEMDVIKEMQAMPSQEPEMPKLEPTSTEPNDANNGKRRKPFSERVNETLTSLFKVVKKTIDVLWQTVVLVTDFMKRRPKDQCFMECVFEDQGFLSDKKIVKDALIARLNITLGKNEAWRKVGVDAVETCYQKELARIPPNSTCASGSEEIFRCVFKQVFFNCPTWPRRNKYCTSLKEFYEQCPDGPPPEIEDNHSTTTEVPVTPDASEVSEVSATPDAPKSEDPAVAEEVTEEMTPTTDRYTEP